MDFMEELRGYQGDSAEEKVEKEVVLNLLAQKGEELLFRTSPLAHVTAAVMVFNPQRDKLLMIKHNILGTWACVGGHADGEGDLLAVAKKELQEETGVFQATPIAKTMLSLDILLVMAHYKRESYVPNHLHINATYAFVAEENVKLSVKEDENSQVAWIPVDQIEAYCKEEDFVKVYKKVIAKIIY